MLIKWDGKQLEFNAEWLAFYIPILWQPTTLLCVSIPQH